MATFNGNQIAFIVLVFILLILSVVLVIMSSMQKNKKSRNMDSFDFYQKKKIMFDLDDDNDISNSNSVYKISMPSHLQPQCHRQPCHRQHQQISHLL